MIAWITDSRQGRAVAAAMFALALALRVLVPAGFMPAHMPSGVFVKMCGGGAHSGETVFVALPDIEGDAHRADPQAKSGPCAFADLSAPALPAQAAPMVAAPRQLLRELDLPPPARLAVVRHSYLLPPLRGPPARA